MREDFKATAEYKRVCNKESFDNWDLAIETLEAWDVLPSEDAEEFRALHDRRNDPIHFHPEVSENAQDLALASIKSLGSITVRSLALWEGTRGFSWHAWLDIHQKGLGEHAFYPGSVSPELQGGRSLAPGRIGYSMGYQR